MRELLGKVQSVPQAQALTHKPHDTEDKVMLVGGDKGEVLSSRERESQEQLALSQRETETENGLQIRA